MTRAAAFAALALLAAGPACAADQGRRDVTVYQAGRQADSFDLPDGDAICVRAHVTEEDPVGGAWRLQGGVEVRVMCADKVVWQFVAADLVLRRAGVERLRGHAHAAPLAAGAPLPRCVGGANPPADEDA